MRKLGLILCLAIVLLCCGCGRTDRVIVDYGASQLYSREEMDAAIGAVKWEFQTWSGCELHTISYLGDAYSEENLPYCNSLRENAGFDRCIVFESSFHTPKNGGDGWTSDEEMTGWKWVLARRGGGNWQLLTWGYG